MERRVLNQDEINALLEACKGSHIYPIIVTALHTGMRKSELLNLGWSDIDFGQQISVANTFGFGV